MKSLAPWVFLLVISSVSPARAGETAVEDMAAADICVTGTSSNRGHIDPDKLRKQLLAGMQSTIGFDLDQLDGNKDGDYTANEIISHLARKSWALSDFVVNESDAYDFQWKKQAYASAGSQEKSEYVLDRQQRYVFIECTGFTAADKGGGGGKGKTTTEPRLRGDVKNLVVHMDAKTVRTGLVLPAAVSFSENFLNDESIFQIQAAAGLATFGYLDPVGDIPYSFIPFVSVNRRFSDLSAEKRIDNTSAGVLLQASLGDNSGSIHDVSAQFTYTTDSKARTEIASAKLYWAPYFGDLLGVRHTIVDDFADLYVLADGQVHVGEVFDDGGKDSLSDSDEYVRGGGQIYAGLRGHEGSSIEGLEAYASYLYLHGFGGRYDEIQRFETGVNYMFGDLGRYGIGAKYTYGRIEDTLEKADFLEGNFLIRF